jgi:CDGSH-type Zn-finger protein/truncated hemoglobin YjbI
MTTQRTSPLVRSAVTPQLLASLCALLSRVSELADRASDVPVPAPAKLPSAPALATRLADSVIRPLNDVLRSYEMTPADQQGWLGNQPVQPAGVVDRLWELTVESTRLLQQSELVPAELSEAVAALQELSCRFALADGPEALAIRLAELRTLQSGIPTSIRAAHNGPYLVTNVDDITDWLGRELPMPPQLALCRCGASALKPYCDGSHAHNDFSSEKDAKRVPDRREAVVGQQVTVLDNRGICQHSGLCTDRLATVFHAEGGPFITPSGGRMDEIIRAVRDCPSGALSFAIDGREAREQVDYDNKREPAIHITKDGPYRVIGGVRLEDGDGNDEVRNEGASLEHYALCRCGQSQNKPFCSGMHWYVGFKDPVPEPEDQPSIFEWCGGRPALLRMTRLFYEKFVPADPLLAPLFASMSADHPERVASWLGEVFCGPKSYSEKYGGYSRMIAHHVGKGLTEEKRARWVSLLLLAANEAGLPNDAEFRSTFVSYLEWGSRLAVENSQEGAKPPPNMPMPHWDWHTAAGSPGSRVSALAPPEPEAEVVVVAPPPGAPVSFEAYIKALFRQRDRQSMLFVFDLWSLQDVQLHADAILQRLRNGSMPCDGAWSSEKIELFARWIDSGKDA